MDVRLVPATERRLTSDTEPVTGKPRYVIELLLCVVDRDDETAIHVLAHDETSSEPLRAHRVAAAVWGDFKNTYTLCGVKLTDRSDVATARGFAKSVSCRDCELALSVHKLVESPLE